MVKLPQNILFLCTGNSARSIIAEAVAQLLGNGAFNAYSAGSNPTGTPNPFALRLLDDLSYDTGFARSKSWEEFAGPEAVQLDHIITVCDNAAGEICPIWPGKPLTAHWGLPDPAAATGSDEEILAAFKETHDNLVDLIGSFIEKHSE